MTRRLLVLAALSGALFSSVAGAPAASATGDDYPHRTDTTNGSDSWGFTKRQCVSFVAWELKQRGVTLNNSTQRWGSAYTWDDTAKRLGKRISSTPKVGAVAQWNAYERSAYYPSGGGTGTMSAGGYGHVAYVTGVYSDGSVRIEQYNMSGNRSFSAMRVKAPRYLYVAG